MRRTHTPAIATTPVNSSPPVPPVLFVQGRIQFLQGGQEDHEDDQTAGGDRERLPVILGFPLCSSCPSWFFPLLWIAVPGNVRFGDDL